LLDRRGPDRRDDRPAGLRRRRDLILDGAISIAPFAQEARHVFTRRAFCV
jgi:hypothetical protein